MSGSDTNGSCHRRDGLRSARDAQEQGQQMVEAGMADLNRKMDNLKDALENRDHILERSVYRFKGEDTIKRSGKECLESAGTVREAHTTSYAPTPASIADRHFIPSDIPGWNRDVMRQGATEHMHPKDLDAMTDSSTNEAHPLSHGDSGYDSDQLSTMRTSADCRERFSAAFLTDLINRSANDAQKYRNAEQYDKAVAAQEKAIKWGREREQNHHVEFKDERDMLQTLAKIQLERRMYRAAEDVLLRLLKGMERDSPEAWALEHELADAYLAQGKYESAARAANRANNGRQGALEIGDNRIAETLTLLSEIHDKMGRRTEAAVFRLEALKHRIRKEGPSDEIMLETLQHEPTEDDVHKIIYDLDDGEDRDILPLKTFQWAVALNQPAIVFSLWGRYEIIATNVDAHNDFGMTPLISSAAFGHEEMVRFLLGKGADVNARASNDSSNDTALMLAAERQSTSMVKQLLARGANVRDYNKHGRNALHRAQGRPLDNQDATRKEIVAMILEKDRDGLINSQCTAGKTPLHLASENGNTPIIDFLLTQGADIEARDTGKRTSLVLAIDSGWPKAVELLLDWGAEQEVEDLMGRTPHRIARRGAGGSREIQALLDKAKKNPRTRRKPSIAPTSPWSPQGRNTSSVSLSRSVAQRSSNAILSPTSSLPSAFSTQRSDGRGALTASTLRLPLRAPSITSMTSSSTAKARRPWSVYSVIDKVGKDQR
jgi:tetratricopeptide (TPR) repeat protein